MNRQTCQCEIIALPSFEEELTEIFDYLSDNASYKAALHLLEDIKSQLDLITALPFIYPAYEPEPYFRKMPINNWRFVVFYAVNKEKHQVVLTHIYHSSRDIQALMRESKYF